MSERAVFWVVGIISIGALVFSIRFVYDEAEAKLSVQEDTEAAATKPELKEKLSTLRFLFSPKVISYFVMIVVPVVAGDYFLSYLFPILAEKFGMSETNMGYSYLLNGLIIIVFSTSLVRIVSNKLKKGVALVVSEVLYAFAFFLYAYRPSLVVLMATLIFLGLSDAFGLPIQSSYYTDLNEVKEYGYEKAMGVYSLFENFSQTMGSYVFAYILMYGVQSGLYIAAGIMILLAFLFFLTHTRVRITRKKKLSDDV